MKKLLLLALWGLLSVAPMAFADDGANIVRFYGYAYDQGTGKYLYTETHMQRVVKGQWMGGTITYTAPDGSLLGKKTIDFANDPFIPVFVTDQVPGGYLEGITDNKSQVVMERRDKTGAPIKTETIKKEPDMAGDSGFHSFIVAHFDELLAGQAVKFKFIAASELDTFKFRIKRVEDGTFEGRPAIHLRAEINSALLRLVAPELNMLYDPKNRQMLEFRGISNVHNPATGDVFDNVRIDYYSKPPADAPKLPSLN